MDERSRQSIKKYLQSEDVQERIWQNMQRGRSEATVTIGRAARLFNFTENQLRDWEERGLLKPLRPTGQRQYSPDELDKLAIIKELIAEGGYSPGAIPLDIDRIWCSISSKQQDQPAKSSREEAGHLSIEQRVERTYHEQLFWRYYASHVLRLSLMLICEDTTSTIAGLVLPLEKKASASTPRPENLSEVGESLIGWLGQTRSFYTFLTPAPSFDYSSDYRILSLQVMKEDRSEEDIPMDRTLVLLERRASPLTLTMSAVETIRRLLAPLYENVHILRSCFGQNMQDLVDPATDFNSSVSYSDTILNGLADMVVRLGGQTPYGQDRWRFCCILLPNDIRPPLQQRSLVVSAQSKNAPHRIGVTTISPNDSVLGLSLRAFQSGHIIFRSEISTEDSTIALREVEGLIRSAIAVPVGEYGQPVAVLYIVSDEPNAFSEGDQHKGDQRVLRIIGRMIEELLRTYYVRQQVAEKLTALITSPSVVDTLFGEFSSENEFIRDIEELLTSIQKRIREREKKVEEKDISLIDDDAQSRTEHPSEEFISFIAIDVDNQSKLANKYGDQMMRNLGRKVGLRIQEQLRVLFTEHVDCRLYHVYADRFYLLLKGISLEQAREKAMKIKIILKDPYQLDAFRPSIEEQTPPDSMQVLSISVRLAVTSYPYTKLEDLLQRYSTVTAVASVRATIIRDLDKGLEKGRIEGGDRVMTWNPDPDRQKRRFIRWPPED